MLVELMLVVIIICGLAAALCCCLWLLYYSRVLDSFVTFVILVYGFTGCASFE